jgi:hypothetical protein
MAILINILGTLIAIAVLGVIYLEMERRDRGRGKSG